MEEIGFRKNFWAAGHKNPVVLRYSNLYIWQRKMTQWSPAQEVPGTNRFWLVNAMVADGCAGIQTAQLMLESP